MSIPARLNVAEVEIACSITNRVEVADQPAWASSGTNSLGGTAPWTSCVHRASASAPVIAPVTVETFGWIVHEQVIALECRPRRHVEVESARRIGVERRLVPDHAGLLPLRLVHRGVGMSEDRGAVVTELAAT